MELSNSQRLAKNSIFLFIRMVLVLLVGLYTSRVVLNVLGFENYGIYSVVGSVVVFLSFLKMALTNATYRYLTYEMASGNKRRLKEIYTMTINSHLILAVVLLVLLEIGGVYFINTELNVDSDRLHAANWVFHFSLLSFCLNVIQTPFNSSVIAHEKMDFYAVVSISDSILKLLVAYLLLFTSKDRLIVYGVLMFLESAVVLLFYIIYCHYKFVDCKYLRFWDGKLIKEFTSYSGWSLTVNAADVTANQCMFINLFWGVVANAALGIAQGVSGQLANFSSTFTQAFSPQIIKSYASKDMNYFMKIIFSSSKISYFMFISVALPITANIEYVLQLWLGDYPAMTPTFLRVIILYWVFESTQYAFLTAVHATGRIKNHQIMMSSLKFSAIPIMYFFLWMGYEPYWVLIVWVSFTFIWCSVRTIYMHFLIELSLKDYFNKCLSRMILITVIVGPIPFIIEKNIGSNLASLVLSILVGTLMLFVLVWGIGFTKEEREFITNLPIVIRLRSAVMAKKTYS